MTGALGFSVIEVSVTPGSLFQRRNYGLDRWEIASLWHGRAERRATSKSRARVGSIRKRIYARVMYTRDANAPRIRVRKPMPRSGCASLAVPWYRTDPARVPNTGTRASRSWKSIILSARPDFALYYFSTYKNSCDARRSEQCCIYYNSGIYARDRN